MSVPVAGRRGVPEPAQDPTAQARPGGTAWRHRVVATGNHAGTGRVLTIVRSDLLAQVRGGAASRNRTADNLITSEVLCRLS
jgi:hypothetical protein